jgi:lipoprotein-anchoring transpeptidase ErfK/SrfK/peptidoglycan hydrolase-like protein with peptidoglycan-binding domain
MTVRSRTGTGTLKARRVSSVKAIAVATKATRASAFWLGVAALALVVAADPAEAGKKPKTASPAEPVAEFDKHEPMIVVVSVGQQKIDVYRGTTLVTTSAVSTGTAEHPTFIGAFSILEKQRWHHSNMYSAAPMPWMNRITWSGTALHAGVVPGYPASHGCIRLTYAFAPKFFEISSVGDNVIVSRGRPKPTPIEHSALFQPLPPPPLPTVGELTPIAPIESTSSRLPAIAAGTASPVILARAEAPTAVDSDAQTQVDEESASSQAEPASEPVEAHPHPVQDSDPNRVHAITPDTTSAAASRSVPDLANAAVGAVKDKIAGTVAPTLPAVAPASDPPPPAPSAQAPAPAAPLTPPPAAAKVDAGVAAAAVQAAEPRSEKPLRVLLTRRTQRDRIIGVQEIFAAMGYLPAQRFDGTMGKPTITAIKAFQKANGMRETGAFNDELVKKVYEADGKGEPPAGHIFVRQDLDAVFDAPVSFRDPDQPLGTHVYTALKFAPGDTKVRWVTLDVQDGETLSPLDRLEIPDDIRQKISERLTPGSTLIIADTSINSANLPRGGDFVVLAKSTGAKVSQADDTTVAKPKPRRRNPDFARRYNYNYNYNSPWRNGGPWFGRPW